MHIPRMAVNLSGSMVRAWSTTGVMMASGLLALGLTMAPAICSAVGPAYTITDLGLMEAQAINDHGQVVGSAVFRAGGRSVVHAVVHDGVEMRDLGSLG